MTKDDLVIENARLRHKVCDLEAKVEVLERKLYWEYKLQDIKAEIKAKDELDSRYKVNRFTS